MLYTNAMFRVMFLSRRESQWPTFVDMRTRFSFSISELGMSQISFLFWKSANGGVTIVAKLLKNYGKNFSFPTKIFQSAELTQSSKIFLKIGKKIVSEIFFLWWNYYTYLNSKYSLVISFQHYPLFKNFQKIEKIVFEDFFLMKSFYIFKQFSQYSFFFNNFFKCHILRFSKIFWKTMTEM